MYDERFLRAVEWVIKTEGGYVNDPDDPGGATNMGVSLRAVVLRDFDRDGARDFDLDMDGDVDEFDIQILKREDAMRLYHEDYWSLGGQTSTCSAFPEPVSVALFDSAILQGPRRAVALLQRSLKLKTDGIVGRQTLAAAAVGDPVPSFLAERVAHYSTIPWASKYMRGWSKRMFLLQRFTLTGR